MEQQYPSGELPPFVSFSPQPNTQAQFLVEKQAPNNNGQGESNIQFSEFSRESGKRQEARNFVQMESAWKCRRISF